MGRLIIFFLGIIVVVVIAGVGVVALMASGGEPTAQCPSVAAASKTPKQIGDTLEAQKSVTISNADATGAGKTYVGDKIDDLRVCFDSAGAHGSGQISVQVLGKTFNVPFYITAPKADLKGSSPKVDNLDFQIGGIPSWALDPAKSQITNIVNGALGQIKLQKQYSVEFSDGAAKVAESR